LQPLYEHPMKKRIILCLFLSAFCLYAIASTTTVVSDTNKLDGNGKKTGIWKEKSEMYIYYGTYKNDKREGVWIGYHPNGIISSIDEYKDGKKNGYSIGIDVAGFYFRKDYYTNDTLDGVCIGYTNTSGPKPHSEIHYRMGKLNGLKKVYYPDGNIQEEGYFTNNLRSGKSKWYTADGNLSMEYTYKNGNMEGPQKTFYPNGNIASEVTAVNNLEEGEYTEYLENGKMKLEGKYIHGKKEGPWKEYDAEGNVIKTEIYKNNELKK
jgi:antitoxin component YwqK of YwqJK toxin-antitoxin module